MAVDTQPLNKAATYPTDTAQTIALFKLPGGNIERAYQSSVLLTNVDESFDYRVDVGVLPEGVEDPDAEGDITWANGAIQKSKSDASDDRESIEVTATYVRVVITTAASADATADLAFTVGR